MVSSEFTSLGFTGMFSKNVRIRIYHRRSLIAVMDARIFIERLWRSLKYEAVYLHELTDGLHAVRVIGEWIRLLEC